MTNREHLKILKKGVEEKVGSGMSFDLVVKPD